MTSNADFRQEFNVAMPVTIRKCAAEDLPELEWFGLFTGDRDIVHDVFRRQERGESLMLIADVNGHPVGQVWIDLTTLRSQSTGWLWAVRVFPWMERLGIGGLLIRAAEQALRRRGFRRAELAADKNNPACRFYERQGYRRTGTVHEQRSHAGPDGLVTVTVEQWHYRKQLVNAGMRATRHHALDHEPS